jgi:branched-chain amino acid aminotransferase
MNIEIEVIKTKVKRAKPLDETALGFGRYFADHMVLLNYQPEKGWHHPRIVPYGPISLEPATAVLQYCQQVFENHKAFRGSGGEIALFRARDYLRRMVRSCVRLSIPPIPEELHYEVLKQLLQIDKDWVPSAPFSSLNIRHTILAMDPYLGVKPSENFLFFIITSPVGYYYSEGLSPVRILVEENYVRSVVGGVGEAKTGGNYAAGLKAQSEAATKGFSQVLWLDALEHRYIEEVGAMNIFIKFTDRLITPPLTGSILPGVTRDCILTLARQMGLKVEEQPIAIDELMAKMATGEVEEVFGTGTAAVVSPVGWLTYKGETAIVANGLPGRLSQSLLEKLTGIQYGRGIDSYGWRVVIA